MIVDMRQTEEMAPMTLPRLEISRVREMSIGDERIRWERERLRW